MGGDGLLVIGKGEFVPAPVSPINQLAERVRSLEERVEELVERQYTTNQRLLELVTILEKLGIENGR